MPGGRPSSQRTVTRWPGATSSTHTGPAGAKVSRVLPEVKAVGAVTPDLDQLPCHTLPSRSTSAFPLPTTVTTGVACPLTSRFFDYRVVTYWTTTLVAPY
jgi:hypothetical protein